MLWFGLYQPGKGRRGNGGISGSRPNNGKKHLRFPPRSFMMKRPRFGPGAIDRESGRLLSSGFPSILIPEFFSSESAMYSVRPSSRLLSAVCAIAMLGSLALPNTMLAGPSTENPSDLFQARNDSTSQEYWERCRTAIDIIMMVLQKIEDAEAAGNVSVVPPREVSEAYVMVEELSFCAGHLSILGEPCARHFQLFATDSKATLLRFIAAYLEIPGVQDRLFSEGSRLNLERVVKAQVGKVKRLQALIRKQEWKELDEELLQIQIELNRYLCWYPGRSIEDPVLKQIFEIRKQYAEQIAQFYDNQASEVLSKLAAEYKPNFDAVIAELDAAIESIGSAGYVTRGNSQLSGPEFVNRFIDDVKAEQVEAIRYHGVEISHSASSPGVDTTLYNLATSQQQFVKSVTEGIGKLISTDASRVSGIDAETLYREYLTALTQLLSLIDDDSLEQPIEGAMLELASKSESFAEDVEMYTTATGDLLRWRERTAAALVKSARTKGEQPTAYMGLSELFASKKINKFERSRGEDIDVDISTWVDQLKQMQQEYIGQPVVVNNLLLSEKQKRLLSPVENLLCATVEMPRAATREVSLLLADLQSAEADSFPLTLEGQLALYHALHYDYAQVGGTLIEVEFDDRVTMMSRCEPGDMARERLRMFEDSRDVSPQLWLDRSVSVAYVSPEWVRSRYFFAYFDKQK